MLAATLMLLSLLAFLSPNNAPNTADGPDSRLPGTPTFHLIVVLDAIHDMTAPQEMLKVEVTTVITVV